MYTTWEVIGMEGSFHIKLWLLHKEPPKRKRSVRFCDEVPVVWKPESKWSWLKFYKLIIYSTRVDGDPNMQNIRTV